MANKRKGTRATSARTKSTMKRSGKSGIRRTVSRGAKRGR